MNLEIEHFKYSQKLDFLQNIKRKEFKFSGIFKILPHEIYDKWLSITPLNSSQRNV